MIDFNYGVSFSSLNSSHNEQLRSWRNDPEIFRWCRQDDLISDTAQERWFASQDADPKIKMYSIFAEKNMVGAAGLTSIERIASHAEFSLYIAPSFQKSGMGVKALKTLLTHAFYNLGLRQVWGETLDKNPAFEMFKAIGMKDDGRRRDFYFKDGRLWDAQLISMTVEEWKKQEWSTSWR